MVKTFQNFYDKALISEFPLILLELELKQEANKIISSRSSTQILDFLGDIGGFIEAITMIAVIFGEYFSAKFFIAQVTSDLYVSKKRD
jgi:hypothetical protein